VGKVIVTTMGDMRMDPQIGMEGGEGREVEERRALPRVE
jgi:hypothetical protein